MADNEVGSIYVSVMPTTAGLTRQVNKELSGAFEESGKSGENTLGRMFRRVAAIAGTVLATVGLGKLIKNTVDLGISYNTLEQSSGKAFETILGSVEAADALQKNLKDFAKSSPFPRQAFIEGTQQLLAFGEQADGVIPILDAIQDAVAAAGGSSENLAEIVDVFASIRSQGKITTNDLNRLADNGINGFDILAQAAGVSGDEIRERISSGAIDADTAITQLTNGMSTKFNGAAEGLKGTWVGAVDRIKGAYRDLASAIVAPFVDPNGGGYAIEWANRFADVLRGFEGSAGFEAITAKLENFGAKLDPIVNKVADLTALLFEDNGTSKFMDELRSMPELSGALQVFDAIAPLLPALAESLANIGPALIDALPALSELVLSILPLIPIVVPPLIELVQSLADMAPALIPVIGGLASLVALFVTSQADLYRFFAIITEGFSTSGFSLETLGIALLTFMGEGGPLATAGMFLANLWLSLSAGFQNFVRGGFNIIIDSINKLKGPLQDVVNFFAEMFDIKLEFPDIPRFAEVGAGSIKATGLATSGTVLPRPGGTLILAAEAGRAESVVDTGKLNDLMDAASSGGTGSGAQINVYPRAEHSEERTARFIKKTVDDELRGL